MRVTLFAMTLIGCWTNGGSLSPQQQLRAGVNVSDYVSVDSPPLRKSAGHRSHPRATHKSNRAPDEKYRSGLATGARVANRRQSRTRRAALPPESIKSPSFALSACFRFWNMN
jgi:hypothetical protein